MKKIASLLLLSIITLWGFSSEGNKNKDSVTIEGVVVDKLTGENLTGVELYLVEAGRKVYTDFDGNFKLDGLNPGTYNIKASIISYKVVYKKLSADNNKEKIVFELVRI